jgi:hypothetical protein
MGKRIFGKDIWVSIHGKNHYLYEKDTSKWKLINGKVSPLNKEKKYNGLTIEEMKELM